MAVVVEDVDESKMESEFVNPGTQTDRDNLSTQNNVWIDGKLFPWSQITNGGRVKYPSVTNNPDTWNGWRTCPQVTTTANGWGNRSQVQSTTSSYLVTMSDHAASLQKTENNLKDTSNGPSISLVEWTTAGGEETHIIHTE